MKIIISKDYSPHPIGRYENDSTFSGERFREKLLVPKIKEAIKSNDKLDVSFDGMAGCSSSFLEEAFGGLYRSENFDVSLAELKKVLSITSSEEHYKPFIDNTWEYIQEAFNSHSK